MSNAESPSRRLSFWNVIAWPVAALAIIGMIIFGAGGTPEKLELGPLKMSFSAEAASEMSPPSEAVVEILRQLRPEEIEYLMAHPEGEGHSICVKEALTNPIDAPIPAQTRTEVETYARFGAFELVEFRPDDRNSFQYCEPGGLRFAYLTDKGATVRRYLVDLLTKTVRFDRT